MANDPTPDALQGRVVVITGAARGIGEALGRDALVRGARLVAIDRHWEDDSPWRAEILAAGGLALSADITDGASLDAAFDDTIEAFGTVHVLVNNAAMRQRDLYPAAGACAVLDTDDVHWQAMFDVNVVGTLKVTRRFTLPMRAQRRGSVVMISANGSLTQDLGGGVAAGNHPGLLNQPYDATKAALTSMSFYLAEELKPLDIAVNVVFPGPTLTTGSEALGPGREALGLKMTLLEAAHLLPLWRRLSVADGSSTGCAYDAVAWNAAQG